MGLLTERHCQLTNRILQNSDLFEGITLLVHPACTMPRDPCCHCPVVYWPEAQTTNFTNWYPVVNATLVIGRPPFITCQTLRVFLDSKQR